MMPFTTKKPLAQAPAPLIWQDAQVAVQLEAHSFLLDDGRLARQATSCLLTPQAGDRVLSVSGRDGTAFIVHVLQRNELQAASLGVPGAQQLTIAQERITLSASDQIEVHALRNIDVTAATGVLSMACGNLFMTVNETLVQNTRNFIGKAGQYLLEVKQLLRLHGQQTILTADKDIKVDAERINMG
ncbi:DUF3540 domain-containing protein [Janthinobacterium sp. PC23-8]|uniref:DUF3540 domain-containing protein n=1 Tax=Janthinobacterium sp. PC23-8 TaxID=2012679 RepID=UPI000B971881|nr:DUF3540 domain-containing protein [Janthinobacterium sp. PC23-8]OYO27463.1 hypothetical protein CD932_19980 [Janthinobacterium sp. PC23-8]